MSSIHFVDLQRENIEQQPDQILNRRRNVRENTDFVTLTVCIKTVSAAIYDSYPDHAIIVSV